MAEPEGKWKPFKFNYLNGSAYGGLIGTPKAFMKYLQALLDSGSKLITPKSKQTLFTENYTNKNNPTGMCLSWFKGTLNNIDYFAHAGGGGGYYIEIRIYPAIKTGSVIVFNRTGFNDERFLDKLDKHIIGR